MSKKKKVFCNKCKWLKRTGSSYNGGAFYECTFPENYTDNWLEENGHTLNPPETRNRNNDCGDFQKDENMFK